MICQYIECCVLLLQKIMPMVVQDWDEILAFSPNANVYN